MDAMDQLAVEWATAKEREDDAKGQRIAVEEKILRLHPAKPEGSESFATPGGAKVTLTGKVTYKCDIDRLIALTGAWPDDVRPVRTKVEADETRLRAIRAESPRLWAQIAAAVETKPAKTGVSIKWKE
tara:strand:- start:7955 stop:8338 length:384 start_codon:yes stop_codon:yes gene_type:complete